MRFHRQYAGSAAVLILTFSTGVFAQSSRVARIDRSVRVTLAGQIHPRARAEYDQGRVSPSRELSYVTLEFAPSASQKAALEALLEEQQNPASPNYHRWLTPEQFADRFGVSSADIAQITSWLESEGLTVKAVARGRNWIAAGGSAAQFEAALHTEMHRYSINGEMHFANSTEPSIPAALKGVVRAIRGLNDFRARPAHHAMKPQYTSASGNHYLSPNDVATIYNFNPLLSAGLDGSGQTIVVAGQTQIQMANIDKFRTRFNLSQSEPQVTLVPGSSDPGIVQGDADEAHLDLEWSGAIARNANLVYVYAADVMTAVQYAIDQNMAPVLSLSYGSCELETPNSDAATMRSWAQQANAQGMTWFAASGDTGGADCADPQNPGLSVDIPGSIPEVTSVGGTEFSEGSGQFWNATTDANGASATSYIPETVWNDSIADGQPSASGGGASIFFPKPSWQAGAGVPADNARHVPDISMSASADHDGYLVYSGGTLSVFGGTSVPTPVFAGLTAILNQYLTSKGAAPGVGNINPHLYALAQVAPSIFHDVTTGDNLVTVACGRRQINCGNGPVGFTAGPGFDQATGLGSVDANQLVTGWGAASVSPKSNTILTLLSNLQSAAASDTVDLIATATGNPTPAGLVTFAAGNVQLGSATLTGSAGAATATLAVKGSQLGSGLVTATFNDISASVNLTVSSGSGAGTPSIAALSDAAAFQQAFAPGGILTIWGSQLSSSTQPASAVPLPFSISGVAVLINGVAAPLYYVSSGLINAQIPYDIAPGPATLSVNNNGQVSTHAFTVAAAAPEIFVDATRSVVPTPAATRGQEIAIYITGAGAVSPSVSTGQAPALATALTDLPKPLQSVTVSVGGTDANIDFIGIPPGLVGVTQINFTVPSSAPPGALAVVVKVGGVPSAAATLKVTN